MIAVEEISHSFSGELLFEKVSFSLQKGERCGLVGRNGSGKSTLLRMIVGKMTPEKGKITIPKHYRIGYLEQHIQFTHPTILEEAVSALKNPDEMYLAEKILSGLGFEEELFEKAPETCSGGYQLRLQLAKVLLSDPDMLLLDEPTNYLDILSLRFLKRFLQKWPREMIIITHDREFMDSITNTTLGIHRKNVRKVKGSSLDFFEQIALEEEVHEQERMKLDKKRAHLSSFIERFGAKATKATQAQSKKKLLGKIPALEKLAALDELCFTFREKPFSSKRVVQADALSFSYTEDPLIEDVSLEVLRAEKIAIIGKNGRGKSTLLKLLAKILSPQQGVVEWNENAVIGFFGQTNIATLPPEHTIEEEIASANPDLSFSQVRSICGAMLFTGDLAKKKIQVLSGGEKSRVLLGKIIATPCNVLMLDEPTHHLDVESIEALMDALEDFSQAIFIVTHSELLLRRIPFDRLIICEDGKQEIFLGSYDEFLEQGGFEEEGTGKKKGGKRGQSEKKQPFDPSTSKGLLKSVVKKITTLEQNIFEKEKRLAELQETLISPEKRIESVKLYGIIQKELDILYAELESLLLEKEQLEKN